MLANDGALSPGARCIEHHTHVLRNVAVAAGLQMASPDGSVRSISPVQSPRSPSPALRPDMPTIFTTTLRTSFLPTVATAEVVESLAAVDRKRSGGVSFVRRQKEAHDYRLRNRRSRSLSPGGRRRNHPAGAAAPTHGRISPPGNAKRTTRLQAEVAVAAATAAAEEGGGLVRTLPALKAATENRPR